MPTTLGPGAGKPTKLPRQRIDVSKQKISNVQPDRSLPDEQKRFSQSIKPTFSSTHRSNSTNSNAPSDKSSRTSSSLAKTPIPNGLSHGQSKSQMTARPAGFSIGSSSRVESFNPRRVDDNHRKGPAVRHGNASKQAPDSIPALSVSTGDKLSSIETHSEDYRQVQRELLQLHALHSISADIHAQWRDSAKTKFQIRFSELAERHTEIADICFQTQELRNRAAVVHWCRKVRASEIDKRVQTLSKCIQEMYENFQPGGKYSNIIQSFEAWYTQARNIQESRQINLPAEVAELTNLEEIGVGWQNDVDALQRSLSMLTGELRTLGSAKANSTLGRVLMLLQDLVIDMLAEMDCIRTIEYELVGQEKLWLENQIASLRLKVHNEMRDKRKSPSKACGYA
ncbi:MAG: hypothetical protein Q9218_002505 [Villophora microphyllina]